MPPSPSKTRRNNITSPNNRKVTDFFKPTAFRLPVPASSDAIVVSTPSQHEPPKEQHGSPRASSKIALNSSFTSVSSASSSRRIVTNGIHAVTNSDSDSFEEGSDDSFDELADADSFVQRKRLMITPPDETVERDDKPSRNARTTRQSSRVSRKALDRGEQNHSGFVTPPRRKYRYSLAEMVKQQVKSTLDDARIAALEAEAQRGQDSELAGGQAFNHSDARNTAVAVADDSDEGDRVLQALERTEALDHEQRFFLFAENNSDTSSTSFPGSTLGDNAWATMMSKDTPRSQACLSGFAATMASRGRISVEVTKWLGMQLLTERAGELCDAYINIIQACEQHDQPVHPSLSSLDTFYVLSPRILDSTSHHNAENSIELSSLPHVLQVLQSCASQMKLDRLCRTIINLALANVDHRICNDAHLQRTVQDAIEHLVGYIPTSDSQQAYDLLRRYLLDERALPPIFQCRAIAWFPATSAKVSNVRRYLALACITRDPEFRPNSSPNWAKIISHGLANTPEFTITDSTDFAHFAEFAEVLDIALDAGFSPGNYPWSQDRTGAQTDWLGRAPAPTPEESSFNAQIDILIARIKAIKSRVKEAGATHLRRLEARNTLERVERRLQYSVRTRARPQKDAFGTDLDGFQRKFMENFVAEDSTHARDGQPQKPRESA